MRFAGVSEPPEALLLNVYLDVPPDTEPEPEATTTVAGTPIADIPADDDNGFPVGLVVVIALVVAAAVIVLVMRRRGGG